MSGPLNLLGPLFHTAEAERIFSAERQFAAMVQIEVALAHALEAAGVAPDGTGAACERGVSGFPREEHFRSIADAAKQSGNLAIPFVKALQEHVRERAGQAADYIHFGATSQDLLDTSLVLCLREFSKLLTEQVQALCTVLVMLAERHRNALLAGRTWLQQGPPVTFALKAAQWLSAMLRHVERFAAARERVAVLQFGGAVGTLASLGKHGPQITRELGRRLALRTPDTPWHSQRDVLAEFAAVLAILDGTLGKMARDLSLMLQNEVAEVELAAEGAGGSSSMAHKRNPVSLAVVLAAAVRAPGLAATMLSAMVQEHERGLGGWHAEWETLPELCRLTAGSVEHMLSALEGLRVDREAMRRNLDRLQGAALAESVSMQLSEAIGRPAAHRVLETACRVALERKVPLLDVLRDTSAVTEHLSPECLERALDPVAYLGAANIFIDQVLARAAQILPVGVADGVR